MYTNCLLGACLALLVGCATVNTPPAQTAYARVEANIPGWGAIVDVRSGQQIDAGQLLDVLAQAPTVMVGETHDNVAHHLIEQWLATGLAERRQQGAVVLEMLDSDQQRPVGDVQAWLGAGNRVRLARLRKIMQWDERWSWEQYGPLMQALMQAPAPVLAGNLSSRERKQVAADAPADAASLFPQAAIAEVQRQRIVQMHCGEIDLPRLNAMLAIQHGRDRRMAQVLDAAPAPRLLFAGVLHTLKSQGAPQYLRHGARDPGLKVLVLGEEGQAPAVQDADFVWLLPSQDGDGVALAPAAASCDAPLQPPLH